MRAQPGIGMPRAAANQTNAKPNPNPLLPMSSLANLEPELSESVSMISPKVVSCTL